jgi:GNAT superfamily N-acetyltransferase
MREGYSIREIAARNAIEERKLAEEYCAECAILELGNAEQQPLIYEAMERTGNFQFFGVFYDSRMVGYFSALIFTSPHYGKLFVNAETIFLARAHRRSGVGVEMMDFFKCYARERGCAAAIISAPVGSRFEQFLNMSGEFRKIYSTFMEVLN